MICIGPTTCWSGLSEKRRDSMVLSSGVELVSESPVVRVLAWSRSLSFEGDSDSRPFLFHLDFCVRVILLQSIQLLCSLFYNKKTLFVHYCATFTRRI